MNLRSTQTFATLEVASSTIADIKAALMKAGPEYVDRYVDLVDGREVIRIPDVELVGEAKPNGPQLTMEVRGAEGRVVAMVLRSFDGKVTVMGYREAAVKAIDGLADAI